MTLQLTRPGSPAMRSKIRNSLLGVLLVASVAAMVALAIRGYGRRRTLQAGSAGRGLDTE